MLRRRGVLLAPARLPALALALVLTGCTGSPAVPPEGPGTSTGASPTATDGTAGPSPSTSAGDPTSTPATGVDCERVEAAKDALDAAVREEMDRLDVGRDDPRAPSVAALVTTMRGQEYYAALVDATDGALRADARLAMDYYESLAAQVGSVDVGTGGAAEIAAALERVDALGADPDVVAAQQRVAQEVELACSDDAPAPDASAGTAAEAGTGG
ncbi:hypothetical protein CLV92_1179 [Kineococcus xinjiangensis]|uniref:Lipoprotein n=1 Tax=Kineococcus xinjiangensis TaxID=512762 RepID=A0A2S6ICX1_9ACTN|nr:hypothetical protein [Kineococcus xinjiangensis]PPK92046.1 hypothetical protein CLV92_1179 [Kineococcus xinjiangensis]